MQLNCIYRQKEMSRSENQAAARSLLQASSLRATPVRTAILTHLLKTGGPVSHGDLWKRKRIRAFNRVTVYRTLLTLQKNGIVHGVQGIDGVWRFCAHPSRRERCPGNHPHFVCTRCRRMICLLGQSMPYVEVPEGTLVQAKQFVVYGLCAECSAAKRTVEGSGGLPRSLNQPIDPPATDSGDGEPASPPAEARGTASGGSRSPPC